MPLPSSYPGGFPNGVMLRGVPILQTHPGQALWVNSTSGATTNKGTRNQPFATVFGTTGAMAYANSAAGDIIMVAPGHTEAVVDATTSAANIADVAVVGLGYGTHRPTFNFTTIASAAIPVSVANFSMQNCIFSGGIASCVAAFVLSTAKGFTLQNCTFADQSASLNFLAAVKTTGAANTTDGMTIVDSQWYGLGTTSVGSFILSANTIDQATWCRNRVILARTADTSILAVMTAGILTNLDCGDNVVISQQTATTAGSLINVGGTTSSGVVYNCKAGTLTTSGDKLFTTTCGLYPYENRVSGVLGATGFVIPAVDS